PLFSHARSRVRFVSVNREAAASPAGGSSGAAARGRGAPLFDMGRALRRPGAPGLYVRSHRRMREPAWPACLQTASWGPGCRLGIGDGRKGGARVLGPLGGVPEIALAARFDDWFARYVERHITDAGREAVERHRRGGELVAIVTGASVYTARPLARRLGIEHV